MMTSLTMNWLRAHSLPARVDKPLLGVVVLLAALALSDSRQALASLVFMGESLLLIAPFLMVSIGLAAYIRAAEADKLIARAFTGHPLTMVALAAVAGGLSPFCSCGVVPIIAALLASGVPLSAVMAFWLASPLMSPEMFLLTSGQLGLTFALAKLISAVGIGLLGGMATLALQRSHAFANPLRPEIASVGSDPRALRKSGGTVWKFWREPERRALFMSEAAHNTFFLGKWMVVAFAIESLMVAYLPAELIAQWLGGDNPWSIPLAVLVGVPAYLNGYAAIPLVDGLLDAGMAPGAGLAFMLAGGVTSIPAAVAVYALARRTVFGWYLALSLAGALLFGLTFQLYAG